MSRYSFGPFTFEARARRLWRGGAELPLTVHQADVLLQLLAHPGDVLSKDALIAAAWAGVAVTDNSLEQAISGLRRALGDRALIQTVPRRGYRFRGEVARSESRTSDAALAALLEPHREWVEGRSALETLEIDAVLRAESALAAVVSRAPDYAPGHAALANACLMHFESTRADELPDADALLRADHHAREATRLDPQYAEGWAALAMVLHRSGLGVQAIAAARRAVMLEPGNWRHHFRLAYVGWGEERLRAVEHTLALFPRFALAHWLAATVHVARQALDAAERELRAAAAAQDVPRNAHRFSSVGAHWLLGLVRLARGDEDEALAQLRQELEEAPAGSGPPGATGGHIYGRECAANTWYAIGAVMLRQGQRADAARAFAAALERLPAHVLAMAGLGLAEDPSAARDALQARLEHRLAQLAEAGLAVDAAMGRAAVMAGAGGAEDAAPLLDEALASAGPGSAGWLIPVDPLLNVPAREAAFAQVLARLRTRAG